MEIAHNYKRGDVSVFSTIKNVGFRLKGDLVQKKYARAIYPPFFFWALLRVMGASGGPLALLQVKKGAFITARELSHKKLKEVLNKNNKTVQRGLRRGSNSLVLFLHNRLSISDMLVYCCCRKFWHVGSHAESPVAFACAWRANFDIFS